MPRKSCLMASGLVDVVVRLVDSIHPLPDSQVKRFGEILRKLKLQISELLLVRFYFLIY